MIGKQIQNYQIGSHLGQGGMGTVYRATDIILGREVALKMLHTPMITQPLVLERFKKEAQVLARLLHPNIAVIYNLIEQDQQHFMVMEYVEGKDLEGLLKQHRVLPPMAVVTAFIQGLEGLHHAHKKGIFHRDIKPSNLILTPDGTVKLMDFGIAKVAGEQRLTQVNRVIGTVEFLAPELIEGKDPSVASDVYAAGMTMYELLCGKLPFESSTDFNLMQEILKKKPVSPDRLNSSVPAALAAIVMKALEKKPESRFADAKAFQSALVQAFPAAREADITYLFSNAVVPLTRYNNTPATGTREAISPGPTAEIPTRGWQSVLTQLRPTYLLRMLNLPALFKGYSFAKLDRQTVYIALAVLVIITTTTVLLVTRESPGADPQPLVEHLDPEKPDTEDGYSGGGAIIPVSRPSRDTSYKQPPGRGEDQITGKEEKPGTGKTPEKKKEPVTKEENKKEERPVPPVLPEEKIIEKTPDPKIEEPKVRTSGSMVLASRLEISLFLREALTENARAGQALSFSVTNPVRYQGQVIVEKGSTASGRIKTVGNKKITVVLQSVSGINGQNFPLQEIELSGRTNEMISNRNYSAYLKKGTIINY